MARCSPSFTPPSSNSPLLSNNGETLLHIAISIEVVFHRDPTVPDRLGPVDHFELTQVFEDLCALKNWFSVLHDWQVRIQIKWWKMIELT